MCSNCGEPKLEKASTSPRAMCPDCRKQRKRERGKEYRQRIYTSTDQRQCEQCGGAFEFERRRGQKPRRCPECRGRKSKRTLPATRNCADCGTEFALRPYQGSRKYCDDCRTNRARQYTSSSKPKAAGPVTPILICQKCGVEFERKQYGKNPKYCPDHRQKSVRNRPPRKNEPGRFRKWAMPARYGLTLEQREQLSVQQDQRCLLCGRLETDDDRLQVDHDHSCCASSTKSCGRCVRGLLCGACNRAIGLLNDDTETMANLIEYLQADGVEGSPNRDRISFDS